MIERGDSIAAGGRGCAAYRQPRQRAQRRASADRRWRSERWRSERWRKWEAASRAGTLCSPGGEQLSARPTAANAERSERLTWRGSSRFEQPACKQLHPPAGRKSRWLTGSIGEPEPVLGVRVSFLSALQPAVTSVSSGVVVWFIYLA